jgi:hypothetical protein
VKEKKIPTLKGKKIRKLVGAEGFNSFTEKALK